MKNEKAIMLSVIKEVEKGELSFDEALNNLYELSEDNEKLYYLVKEYEKSGVEAMIFEGVLTNSDYAAITEIGGGILK